MNPRHLIGVLLAAAILAAPLLALPYGLSVALLVMAVALGATAYLAFQAAAALGSAIHLRAAGALNALLALVCLVLLALRVW
ncbi:MAG: hypothetical protein M3R06_04955 [Chloroflexota bacterium]|nr:hypothetical protein [Chloroflexota bacterium]